MSDSSEWQPTGYVRPAYQRDLPGDYQATIGPPGNGRCWWQVLENKAGHWVLAAGGWAAGDDDVKAEDAAKAIVQVYADALEQLERGEPVDTPLWFEGRVF